MHQSGRKDSLPEGLLAISILGKALLHVVIT